MAEIRKERRVVTVCRCIVVALIVVFLLVMLLLPFLLWARCFYYNWIVYDESILSVTIANEMFTIALLGSPLCSLLALYLSGTIRNLLRGSWKYLALVLSVFSMVQLMCGGALCLLVLLYILLERSGLR
ncbi:MAG: hypothetical protein IJA77_01815 [Clostridia bacterium]|nr:hypothetical protein [Clostridia bacterium]